VFGRKSFGKARRSPKWGKGITKRAFYVVGAYRAQQIEEKLGKEALVSAFPKTPSHFVKIYDSVADNNLKIN
jgi:hypothetical protein